MESPFITVLGELEHEQRTLESGLVEELEDHTDTLHPRADLVGKIAELSLQIQLVLVELPEPPGAAWQRW
jgi:hypothetical protein